MLSTPELRDMGRNSGRSLLLQAVDPLWHLPVAQTLSRPTLQGRESTPCEPALALTLVRRPSWAQAVSTSIQVLFAPGHVHTNFETSRHFFSSIVDSLLTGGFPNRSTVLRNSRSSQSLCPEKRACLKLWPTPCRPAPSVFLPPSQRILSPCIISQYRGFTARPNGPEKSWSLLSITLPRKEHTGLKLRSTPSRPASVSCQPSILSLRRIFLSIVDSLLRRFQADPRF